MVTRQVEKGTERVISHRSLLLQQLRPTENEIIDNCLTSRFTPRSCQLQRRTTSTPLNTTAVFDRASASPPAATAELADQPFRYGFCLQSLREHDAAVELDPRAFFPLRALFYYYLLV